MNKFLKILFSSENYEKILNLSNDLSVEFPTALGHLLILYANILKQQPDGNLNKWSDSEISRMARWKGWNGHPDSEFRIALQNSGFMEGPMLKDFFVKPLPWNEKK